MTIPKRSEIPPRTEVSVNSLKLMGIPRQHIKATIDDYVAEDETEDSIKDTITKYLDTIRDAYDNKTHVLLTGNNGTGKSMIMSIIAKQAYKYHYNVCYVPFARLMGSLFNTNPTEADIDIRRSYRASEFLCIDEVGKEHQTRSGSNVTLFEQVLKDADDSGKVIILASNFDRVVLEETYGSTVGSLLETFIEVSFSGNDRRADAKNKNAHIEKMRGMR